MAGREAAHEVGDALRARHSGPAAAKTDTVAHPDLQAILSLQRTAGNAAVGGMLWALSGRIPRVVQRLSLDLPAGGSVGDPPATNHREGVMLVLNRLHELWAIENADYAS